MGRAYAAEVHDSATAAPVRAPRRRAGGLHLGLIGFGRLPQRYYAPALSRMAGIGAVTVADPLPASRAAAARALRGARIVADSNALLAAEPDAVVIATPPSTHLALWNTVAERGIPVLMEKPFVLDGELGRAARGDTVEHLLMVDFNRRFWPPYTRLAALARGGAVGTVHAIEIVLHVDVAPWCTVTAHRLAAGEGGVLYDLGSNALDLAYVIAGADPIRVVAHATSRRWSCDHVRLDVELASGARVACDLAYETRTFERVTVRGSTGTLTLPDPNMGLHRLDPTRDGALGRARRRLTDLALLGYHGAFRGRSMARATIATALERFAGGVASGARFEPGFADAVRVCAWLEHAQVEVGT